ncbi:hypothetical protein [Metamycoplasma equirhinis]|uniref:hypothetical protein n=1 Tax=Metamycoplasma equirhinis TaxID=92402 RepID=UPI003593E58A
MRYLQSIKNDLDENTSLLQIGFYTDYIENNISALQKLQTQMKELETQKYIKEMGLDITNDLTSTIDFLDTLALQKV